MKNFILATAAAVALSFAASTAMADHNHHSNYGPRCAPYATPYQAYRYSPSYSNRYYGYGASPYHRGAPIPRYGTVYGNGYPGYSNSGIGVNGRNFSLYFGF
jgi:hypothetical protein